MPFIVRCPHANCRKYMLLEDDARGGKAECPVCKRAIEVDSSGSSAERRKPPVRSPAGEPGQGG